MDAILSGAIISIYSRKPYSFSYSVKKGNVEREGGAVPTRQCKKKSLSGQKDRYQDSIQWPWNKIIMRVLFGLGQVCSGRMFA